MKSTWIWALVMMMFVSACATKRKAGWERESKAVELSSDQEAKLTSEAESFWLKRYQSQELLKALALYEQVAQSNPMNLAVLEKLSRGYYFLADAHSDNMADKIRYWEVGASWGEKAMATNKEFRKKVQAGAKVEDALDTLSKKEIAGIYWTAANLGKWAKSAGISTTLKYKNRIRMLVKKVQDLDEKFFFAAAHRYWGGYYAVAPSFAGGDMNKSLEHFKKAMKLYPDYLGTSVLYAELYLTKKGEKAEFKNILENVIKANAEKVPEISAENKIEQIKAKKMLKNMEDYF